MRNILRFLAGVVLACSLVGCGSATTEEASNNVELDSTALRVAVLPTMECLPFYVAQECGLYDSLHLSVNLLTFNASMDADTALHNKRTDVAVTDLVKANLWCSQGDSISILMSADLNLYLVTAATARIKSAKSLKEKIIAITRHSALDYSTDQILTSVNLKSEELNKPQINNIALRASMLDQQQYDGALLPEPYATVSEGKGARRVIGSGDVGCAANMMVLVASDSVQKARKADISLLLKAYDMAVDLINKKAKHEAPLLLSYLPMDEQVPDSLAHVPQFKHAAMPPDSATNSTRQWLKSRSLVK